MIQKIYVNLQHLYNQGQYQFTNVWNVNALTANASRNGIGKVFASIRAKSVYSITSNKKKWINVFTSINANGDTIFNYYIFK